MDIQHWRLWKLPPLNAEAQYRITALPQPHYCNTAIPQTRINHINRINRINSNKQQLRTSLNYNHFCFYSSTLLVTS